MTESRFRDESFSFLDYVNPKIFQKWANGIPADKIQQLTEKYGPWFNVPNLQSQVAFVDKDKDFHKDNSMLLYRANMQTCFPEIVKSLKLNAVMEVLSASAERPFSCLGRVLSPKYCG